MAERDEGGAPAGGGSEWSRANLTGAFACLVGQACGSSLLAHAALPLLLVPITGEFGWTATAFSAAVTFLMISGAVSGPLIGRLIDRLGARRVILAGTFAVGLCTASLAWLDGALWTFYLVHALLGVFGTTALGYVKVISSLFRRNRAKALAIFGVEAALAGAAAPIIIEPVLSGQGWRAVYLGLGLLILAVLPVLYALLPTTTGSAAAEAGADEPGAPAGPALRSAALWMLLAAVVLGAVPRIAFMIHIVPFLIERGYDAASAAGSIALVTLAGLGGSLLAGMAMDRYPTPLVALPFQFAGLAALGVLAALGNALGGTAALVTASLLFGLALQVHLPIMSFFVTQLFGLRAFGQIYGVAVAIVAASIGLAAPAVGWIVEHAGGYEAALWAMAAGLVTSQGLYWRLAATTGAAGRRR